MNNIHSWLPWKQYLPQLLLASPLNAEFYFVLNCSIALLNACDITCEQCNHMLLSCTTFVQTELTNWIDYHFHA